MRTYLFAAWAALVLAVIASVYPELLRDGPRRAPFARPAHPATRMPVHAEAYAATGAGGARGGVTSQYRGGPAHLGVADGAVDGGALALDFEHHAENVGIHDASKASPAVDATGVYLGFDTGKLVAFDHRGNRRWQFAVAKAARGIHATAALDADRVYLGAYNGTLYALDKRTGAPAWVIRLGDTLGSSVAVVGDDLYVAVETFGPPDGFVAKLDRRTGEVRWLSGWLGEQAHSTPTVDAATGLVFVGANNRTVRALSARDGSLRWKLAVDGSVKGTLALAGGAVHFGTMGKGVGSLWAVEAATGEVRWRRALTGKTRSSATIVPELDLIAIGADDGTLAAFDRATGAPRWALATDHRPYPGSATAVRDPAGAWQLLAPCAARSLCAIDAATGVVRSKVRLAADLTGAPAVWDGAVYASSDKGGGLARLAPRAGR